MAYNEGKKKVPAETIVPGHNSYSASWKPFCSFLVCISSVKQSLFWNIFLVFTYISLPRAQTQYADFQLYADFFLLSCM